MLWLGVAFPDGLMVLDEPNAGFMTDPMAWGTSNLRTEMIRINLQRTMLGLLDVHLYGDRIFRTDAVITAAYSARWGVVQQWMLNSNLIMSSLRVSVEWTYGKVKYLFKSLSLKMAQKLMSAQPVDDFILATFFMNCRTCLMWDGPFRSRSTFGVVPPSLDDYLNQ